MGLGYYSGPPGQRFLTQLLRDITQRQALAGWSLWYHSGIDTKNAGRSYQDKGKQVKKMAERVGFEPTVEFPQHTLSKRAP